MPLAAAPRLDHLGGDDVDQQFREQPPFGVVLEVVGGLVPAEVRIEHQREEQIVAVVDDDQLAAGTLQCRVVDQVLLGAVRADVALQRELARDDLLDRDLLVPAVAAVLLFTARLRHFFGTAQRAPRLDDRLAWHIMQSSTMERPTHAGLRHLALNVTRLAEMKSFYVDLLGFAVEWQPDPDNIYLSSGVDNLALHRAADAAERGAAAPGALDHLGLIVR